jgi:putative hemolysin
MTMGEKRSLKEPGRAPGELGTWMEAKRGRTYQILPLLVLAACVLAGPATGAINPMTVYCSALGYNTTTVSLTGGDVVRRCVLPDGRAVDEAEFFWGRTGLEYSYCAQQGFTAVHLVDSPVCRECTGCILENGTTVRVSSLMGLAASGAQCGDNLCTIPENYQKCPGACPSGSSDAYCDGLADGKCDPDCGGSAGDRDCVDEDILEEEDLEEDASSTGLPLDSVALGIAGFLGAAWLTGKRRRDR